MFIPTSSRLLGIEAAITMLRLTIVMHIYTLFAVRYSFLQLGELWQRGGKDNCPNLEMAAIGFDHGFSWWLIVRCSKHSATAPNVFCTTVNIVYLQSSIMGRIFGVCIRVPTSGCIHMGRTEHIHPGVTHGDYAWGNLPPIHVMITFNTIKSTIFEMV